LDIFGDHHTKFAHTKYSHPQTYKSVLNRMFRYGPNVSCHHHRHNTGIRRRSKNESKIDTCDHNTCMNKMEKPHSERQDHLSKSIHYDRIAKEQRLNFNFMLHSIDTTQDIKTNFPKEASEMQEQIVTSSGTKLVNNTKPNFYLSLVIPSREVRKIMKLQNDVTNVFNIHKKLSSKNEYFHITLYVGKTNTSNLYKIINEVNNSLNNSLKDMHT
jgi:hypothetical protein